MATEPTRVLEHAEHFDSLRTQVHAARLGMWTFLASEMLLFAGFFGLYVAYRGIYPNEFHEAAKHTHLKLGTINTFILITSSFTVAFSIHAVRSGRQKLASWLLGFTILAGFAFLGVKSIEYKESFAEGIFPGSFYNNPELPTHGANIFYTLYFFMTGLHALHVMVGMGILIFVARRTRAGWYGPRYYLGLELGGMYWHLVDLVWIFLWPMFYLVE